jgi:hypothetical protein
MLYSNQDLLFLDLKQIRWSQFASLSIELCVVRWEQASVSIVLAMPPVIIWEGLQ